MRMLFGFAVCCLAVVGLLPRVMHARFDVMLDVPFVVQAPHGNWAQPYQDACEEASLVMVDAFLNGDRRERMPAREADRRILDIVALERAALGYDRDTDVATMADLVNDFFTFEAYVVEDPSLDMLLAEIDAGRPIIIPMWGSYLENPYFTPPGPTYHTVVAVGYDRSAREFIVHEPGTRRGGSFRYGFDAILSGMQDFVAGPDGLPVEDPSARRVLMVRTEVVDSGDRDADQDGLTKREEIALATSLMRADTDGDGYIDGHEVNVGYSPLVDEGGLVRGDLVKSADDPRVYVLEGGFKRHIVSERAFVAAGYRWSDIAVVSEKFLLSIPTF